MTEKKGRKTIITENLIQQIKTLKDEGHSINEISNKSGVSRSTIYKVMKKYLGYKSQFHLKKNLNNN